MKNVTIKVFDKTDKQYVMRLIDADGKLMHDRELDAAKVEQLLDEVEAQYHDASPQLGKLGRRLYDWLDGPKDQWLNKAFKDTQALALHLDVAGRPAPSALGIAPRRHGLPLR